MIRARVVRPGHRLFWSLLSAAILSVFTASPLTAQSGPSPTYYMYDSRPNNGYPPLYPGQSLNPQAVVVEGVGARLGGSCLNYSTDYSEANIKAQTVAFINNYDNVVTEVSPQAYCGSLSAYEALIDRIVSYVETYAGSLAPQYWAGIMLDEEPGFQFSASDLEALNNHVYNTMHGTPGMSYFFLEDQPNGWGLSTYNAILGFGWPAPQVYSSSMLNAVNSECTTYQRCTNLVTVGNLSGIGSWSNPSYTLPQVTGSAWSTTYSHWLPYYGWWNGYRNQ